MKYFLPFLILLLILSKTSSAQDSKVKSGFVGRIDESILKAIVNIDIDSSTGTGFIINKGEDIFLVTCKHMVGKWSLVDPFILSDSIIVHFYPASPDSSIRQVIHLKDKTGSPSKNLILHPIPDVDIAIIKLNEVYANNPTISKNYIPLNYLKPLDSIGNETSIGFGSQIFTIGYPNGIKLAKSNYPIAKAAFIVSTLSGKLEVMTYFTNRKNVKVPKKLSTKFFLVDGLIIGGNSGGPIIAPKDFTYTINDKLEFSGMTYPVGNSILGVVSFVWTGVGLTVIYPCDYILELIK